MDIYMCVCVYTGEQYNEYNGIDIETCYNLPLLERANF